MAFIEIKTSTFVFLLFVTISGVLCMSPYRDLKPASHDNLAIDDDSCDSEYSCVNCTAVRICAMDWKGSLRKKLEFQCDSDKPYCDPESGTCRSTPSVETCAPVDPDFDCPTEGYYPNPSDCSKYYTCNKGVAYLQSCDGYYYNSKSENCESSTCYQLDCSGQTTAVKIPYGSDNVYYGYCLNETLVRFEKCPGRFQLDTVSQICKPTCTEEGEQGDPYDCTRYYKCSYSSSWVLSLTHLQCPEGEVYDALNRHCTPLQTPLTCTSGHTFIRNRTYQ